MILFENTAKEYPRLEARLQAVDICFVTCGSIWGVLC